MIKDWNDINLILLIVGMFTDMMPAVLMAITYVLWFSLWLPKPVISVGQ